MLMEEKCRLKSDQLTRIKDTENLHFNTTADLEPLRGIIGQNVPQTHLTFGFRVNKKGYNIYIAGISGTGRSSYARSMAEKNG